jgi:hypothetical protein
LQLDHYADFLAWGDSGTDAIVRNFTPAAQRHVYGPELHDPLGWENVCSYLEMEAFITSTSGGDSVHCSYTENAGAGYLQGCAAGFFAPGRSADVPPLPCPLGFFCPRDYACTVACVPGSQCFNSTRVPPGKGAQSGRCSYPKTMAGARYADPLPVLRPQPASANTTQGDDVDGRVRGGEAVARGLVAGGSAAAGVEEGVDRLAGKYVMAPPPRPLTPTWTEQQPQHALRSSYGVVSALASAAGELEALRAREEEQFRAHWFAQTEAKLQQRQQRRALGEGPSPSRELGSSDEETDLVCPGAASMFLCAGGNYCPTAVTSFTCNSGTFCPVGSVVPKECSGLGEPFPLPS